MRPRGVLKPGQEGKACCLLKGLYGLKQARHGWYQELTKVLVGKLGFKRSALDRLVFYRCCDEEHTVVSVATNDMALTFKRTVDIAKLNLKSISTGTKWMVEKCTGTLVSKLSGTKQLKLFKLISVHILKHY